MAEARLSPWPVSLQSFDAQNWSSSISITWEFIGNADSQAPHTTYWIRICIWTQPGDSFTQWSVSGLSLCSPGRSSPEATGSTHQHWLRLGWLAPITQHVSTRAHVMAISKWGWEDSATPVKLLLPGMVFGMAHSAVPPDSPANGNELPFFFLSTLLLMYNLLVVQCPNLTCVTITRIKISNISSTRDGSLMPFPNQHLPNIHYSALYHHTFTLPVFKLQIEWHRMFSLASMCHEIQPRCCVFQHVILLHGPAELHVWLYHSLLICSSTDGHLGRFHFLAFIV